jgi:hypothetical protein
MLGVFISFLHNLEIESEIVLGVIPISRFSSQHDVYRLVLFP